MARNWTSEQRLAIDTKDKSLLVSAAAGSGKTATLTARIIESILDEKKPADISKMLIVTFTRAAVGELRERISAAIKERLSERPSDKRLEEQLMLLPSARILTIDAFCNDCLKSFPEAAGIAPGYRIADEAEILLISREIFDGLTEAILRGEMADVIRAEELEELTDCLADSRKMGDIFDIVRKIYEKLRNTAAGIASFLPFVEEYNPDSFEVPEDTVFGRYIFEREKEEFSFRAELFSELANRLYSDPLTVGNLADVAKSDSEAYTRVKNSASFAEMRQIVSALEFEKISTPRGSVRSPLMQSFLALRDKEKKLIADEKSRFFIFSDEDWRGALSGLHPLMETFYKLLSLFDSALENKKRKLSTFDYTDIERLCHSVLVKDGEPTDIALGLREQFSYVYIDEYQDVNDLQDAIFRALSRENNRFAVGDIKQSIYGFRGADPTIFADAKRSYPRIESSEKSACASLFMSKNFRSSGGVIDFVNSVFDKVFSAFSESIDYTEADRLSAGREALGASYFDVPSLLVCLNESDADSDEDEQEGGGEKPDDLPTSARAVASKIREFLDTGALENGSPVKPSDIAIILRSLKNKSEPYVEALKKEGIPVKTSGKKSFFMNPDVLLALCLLNTIDNPLRDVYLTGLLRSPLFSFTPDELVLIRGSDKYCPYYQSLVSYTKEHPNFEKGKVFLKTLDGWRSIAEGMRTDKLLSRLYRQTGLLALASESGGKENLIRLYEYARSFEGSSFGGLGSFIGYINNVIAENGKFDCNIASAEEDAVTVISAHSSKGLEYPIVFFADAGRPIRCRDTAERFLYLGKFGAAMRARTPSGLAVVNNPMINALAEKMKEENLEEELRILYVALTRARERLFVIGSVSEESIEEYREKLALISPYLKSRSAVRRLCSHLDIIAASSGIAPERANEIQAPQEAASTEEKHSSEGGFLNTGPALTKKMPQQAAECAEEKTASLGDVYTERFSYKYHSLPLTKLPEKMSVSALFPTVLDGTEDEISESVKEKAFLKSETEAPEFVSPSAAKKSRDRGIATHLFLQFCELENLCKNGFDAELSRLVCGGFISERDAELIRIHEINAFVNSGLFERMRCAKKIWREFRFNTMLPAALFTEDEKRSASLADKEILVQGVMDCILEEGDGTLSLIDYKTDRLTEDELQNPALAEERLRRAHENQLYYYRLAAERIFGKQVARAEIYSLHLGKTVNVMKKKQV